MKHVGHTLEQEIKKRGIVKSRLAEQLGVPRSTITYMMQRSTMDITRYEEICKYIGCSPLVAFDYEKSSGVSIGDISQSNNNGDNAVHVNDGMLKMLVDLLDAKDSIISEKDKRLEDKDRVIKLLSKMIDPDKLTDIGL